MPTDSLEVVVVIMEVDMKVDEEADNGMDKELDMNMGEEMDTSHLPCDNSQRS